MKTIKCIVAAVVLGLVEVSCNSWLDVKPIDKISENQLYDTERGFQVSLNGIYLDLADNTLYGENLSCGLLDVWGQRYLIKSQHAFESASNYQYNENNLKSKIGGIWKKMYDVVSNCNLLLLNLEGRKELFSAKDYNLYLGEAYALRAYLHLDLFRLFGPVYEDATKGDVSIPYYDRYVTAPMPLIKAEEFAAKVLNDLDLAISLLKKDPVLADGVVKEEGFWKYRNFRMNYYAVWALKARACLHFGMKEEAFTIASRLLEGKDPETQEANNFMEAFPFVDSGSALSLPDCFFYSELLFSLHNLKRNDIKKRLFSPDLKQENLLCATVSSITELYITENPDDLRYIKLWNIAPGGGKETLFLKFDPVEGSSKDPYRGQVQSMIRLGELYLIAAEASSDEAVRVAYLEKLRIGRKYLVGNMQGKDSQAVLKNEYGREFYGEGQYFFYLKRNNVEKLTSQNGESFNMRSFYKLPMPDSEINNRYE